MRILSRLRSFYRGLLHRSGFEQEIEEEMRFHLQSRVDDLERRGLPRDEAIRTARLEFGNPASIRDLCRQARGLRLLDELGSDVRFALRNIRRHALLSAAVFVTLTFGIGISSAVFTFVNADVLRARIESDPSSFVRIYAGYTVDPTRPGEARGLTFEDYQALRANTRSLHATSSYVQTFAALGHDDDPTPIRALLVSCNFFEVYGLDRAMLGRLLLPADCEQPNPIIVISESLWRSRFAADPAVLGRIVEFNDQQVTVVGVVRSPFAGQIDWSQAWLPHPLQAYLKTGPDLSKAVGGHLPHQIVTVEGRLASGYSRADAAAEIAVLAAGQDRAHPRRSTVITVTDGALIHEPGLRKIILPAVSLMMAVLVLVVLLACANVTTLLLARADARRQEVAIRLSLGAGRRRLVRMLLTETLLLASLAGAAGVYLANALPTVFAAWLVNRPLEYPLNPDWRVFGYLTAVTALAGLAAGLTPALQSMDVGLVESLKGNRRFFGAPAKGSRVRSLLVGAQVAVGLVLLLGAGLFVRVHQRLMHPEPGYETTHVLMPAVIVRDQAARPSSGDFYHRTLAAELESLSGVRAVAFVRKLPVGGNTWGESMSDLRSPRPIVEPSDGGPLHEVLFNEISPGALDALGIPILAGRGLRAGDPPCGAHRSCPVVVSEALVRELFGGKDPIGQSLRTSSNGIYDVVGVARDTASVSFWEVDGPLVYQPWSPESRRYSAIVRFSGDPPTVSALVSRRLRETFPGAIVEARTLQGEIDLLIRGFWRLEVLMLLLGALALALALLGIYGVVSFAVSLRTKELGIRRALGARNPDIYATVMGSCARAILIGLTIGLFLAGAGGLSLASLLDKSTRPVPIDTRDPLAYAAVTLLLGVAALLAMAGPARRAARCAPIDALREN